MITERDASCQARQIQGIAFFIQTELNQRILLVRNPDINALAGTWSSSVVGLGYTDEGIATDIRNGVKDCVDAFIKAYSSVNPKTEGKEDRKSQGEALIRLKVRREASPNDSPMPVWWSFLQY